MKTQHLLPVLAAAIGFSIAWIVKPSGNPAAPASTASPGTVAKPGRSENPRPRPAAISEKRPKEVNAAEFPLADLADQGPKTRTEAKMMRLSEALDLTVEQQGEIIKALEESKAAATDEVPAIVDLTTRGRALEEQLSKILSPEQFTKFQELRVRERENQVEARAQKSLTQVIEEVDLSPGQRDDVLARLRQAAKEQIQSIPAAATLLLNTSMLPTESKDLSIDGALVLEKIEQEPTPSEDPMAAHRKVLQSQREELEERLRCFDGILTPGQMAQIHAAIAESRANLDAMEQFRKDRQLKLQQQAPAAPGAPPSP